MKHPALSVAIAALAAHARAAEPLSSAALDDIVAGSESSAASESDATQSSWVVTDRATLATRTERELKLRDVTQSDLRALNLVNGVQADVGNGVNVVSNGVGLASQGNAISQRAAHGAQVESIDRQNGSHRASIESTRVFDAHSDSRSLDAVNISSRSRREVVDSYNASVPAYYPLQNLTLTLGTPALPSVTVPSFSFDLTTTDDVGGVYGIRGALGPFRFDPPQLVLGTVSLSGDDILIRGGYVQLPSLDLGSATVDLCVVKCGGVSVDLPTINGPRIDFGAEYRLPGANPFKDVRVNAGGGVSLAGRGTLNVDLGHVRVGADVSLDLPDLTTSFGFDVLGHRVDTGKFGVEIPPISASIDLIDADIGTAYRASFDGALCLAIVTTRCDGLSHRESVTEESVNLMQREQYASSTATASLASQGASEIGWGATLKGADANLIAMSDAQAAIDTTSTIELTAQAQRGMKVFNAVNATGAMVGNAVNVATPRATQSSALSQSNAFSQFQTRPRGR